MKNAARRRVRRVAIAGMATGLALLLAGPAEPRAQAPAWDAGGLRAALETLAAVPGEPRTVSAAGMTRDDIPLLTIENDAAFDFSRPQRRLVLVGDPDGARIVRLSEMDGDASLRDAVLEDVGPWLSGDRPLFGDRISFAAIAGTMIFSEIARSPGADGAAAARLAATGVALAAAETAPGTPRYASGWSDDFYLGTIAAVRAGDAEALAAAVRLVTATAARLQQPSGLYHQDAGAPTAWGRGNGFGALGLAELLTVLPPDHPDRETVLDTHRRHLAAMRAHQAPDGMWRQIVDVPGSYRETSVTAMTLTAMARGLRLGWLDESYRPVVDRAWRALLAHVLVDGALVDVCFSTGAGPTRRHYLDRPAVNGADDRGGAMVLGAALEYHDLLRPN